MIVHLVDGTYEIFRQYYAPRPGHLDSDGIEIGATRGVVQSVFGMLQDGATHLGVATDHVIESFRNDMWPTYKSSAGMDPLLLAQFDWLEDALRALGVAVWPMVDVEADDGLASAAVVAADDPRVEQVIICTPDKDLGQCVGGKVVQLDRRQDKLIDADGVVAKFGVPAESIADWLALVGDSADGFPGLPGFGAKIGSDAARPLRPPRRHPGRRRRLGRHGAWRGQVGGDARRAARGRRPVQGVGHRAHGRRRRHGRRLAVDRPDRRVPGVVRAVRLAAAGADAPRWPPPADPEVGAERTEPLTVVRCSLCRRLAGVGSGAPKSYEECMSITSGRRLVRGILVSVATGALALGVTAATASGTPTAAHRSSGVEISSTGLRQDRSSTSG